MAHLITIQPSGIQFTAEPGQTILEAATTAGLSLPHACRGGDCGACEGKILDGQVDYGEYQESLLTDFDKENGLALFCAAKPLSDLSIEAYDVILADAPPILTLSCQVQRMEKLCHDVMGIWLAPPADQYMRFLPGQFIDILLEDGRCRSYSLANPPEADGLMELHVRRVPNGLFSEFVFNTLKTGDRLNVKGPHGTFYLRESDKPILCIAGGTGFAPIKSMLAHAFSQGLRRKVTLYWGARRPEDVYMANLPAQWQQTHANFGYTTVLSDTTADDHWAGRTGHVHQAVLEDYPDLSEFQVYACGAPVMIDAIRSTFGERGMQDQDFFCDAFSFQRAAAP
jgi:CDP-4-dehydro-6-deoxyglucose reductase